jgi:predicted nucleotidyltransferase
MSKKLLCEYIGGSHSYGLNTPSSDIDYRGVYKLTDIGRIINPRAYESTKMDTEVQTTEQDGKDAAYYEFRHFIQLLGKGNTGSMETLFNDKWKSCNTFFINVQNQKRNLIDPEKLKKSVVGYAYSEYELAIGNRTGKLGGKRFETVQRLGFSPKNFVNLFRLLYSAETFFETGIFPVDLKGSYIYPQLMEIKTCPERFNKVRLTEMRDERMKALDASWDKNKDKISKEYKHDQGTVNKLVLDCYIDELVVASPRSWLKRLAYKLVP